MSIFFRAKQNKGAKKDWIQPSMIFLVTLMAITFNTVLYGQNRIITPEYLQEIPVPQGLKEIYHWTSSTRFEGYRQTLESGKLPLRPAKVTAHGIDNFFAVYEQYRQTPAFYTWSDVVGGMGVNDFEFYAKLDLASNKKPRLIAAQINQNARVAKVRIRKDYQGNIHYPDIDLSRYDLILHEFYVSNEPNHTSEYASFREWIVVSNNAYTSIKFRYLDILPIVQNALHRAKNNRKQVRHISPVSIVTQRHIETLEYIVNKGPSAHMPQQPNQGNWFGRKKRGPCNGLDDYLN